MLLKLDGVRLLTDPLLRDRASYLRRQVPNVDPAKYADIDAVLVSHMHPDHLDLPSLERLPGREELLVVVPRGGSRLLTQRGFRNVAEVEAGEEVQIGALRIRATYAKHGVGWVPFGTRVPALGYVVTGSRRVYFAGDTGIFEGMANMDRALDVALVPIGGWGPLAPFWERFPLAISGHLDSRSAAEALRLLRPLVAVPIHWGTYALPGLGRTMSASLNRPPRAFRQNAAELAPEVEVRVLNPGEALRLDPVEGP